MSWKRTKCVVESCKGTPTDFPDRKFFRFPKPENANYERWLQAIGISVEFVKKRKVPYICSIHFRNEDIGKKFLKRDAVPSLSHNNSKASSAASNEQLNLNRSMKTYVKIREQNHGEQSDFTVEELNEAAKYIPHKRLNEKYDYETDITCSKCIKHSKNAFLYVKKINKLNNEIQKLRDIVDNLRKGKKNTKNSVNRYQRLSRIERKKTIDEQIDSLKTVSSHAKTLSKLILRKRKVRYTDDEKWLSQCIFFRSTAGYRFLKENLELHLPSISSLHSWIKIKSLSPGPNPSVLKEMSTRVSRLSEFEKDVVLLFDEMYIQENLTFNKFKDRIDSFVDFGNGESQFAFSW